jgi:hypothetical protein
MSRFLCLGLLSLCPAFAFAQSDPQPKDGKVTITLTLQPTAAPTPLSKCRLYPEYDDMQPGNRVQGLLKCFMEQDIFFRRVNTDEFQKFLTMPLSELPKDIRQKEGIHTGIVYDEKHTQMMGYADRGARYSRIEWNEWFDLRKDGFYLLLPEVQKIRSLAQVVRLRLRGEIKNGEFIRACESVKTLLGIAQAMEQHPTLIGYLVGAAVAAIALQGLEEMIQQPNCPNLYWALSDLPSPLLSLRMGLGGERTFAIAAFGDILKGNRAFTDQEIRKFFTETDEILKLGDPQGNLFQAGFIRYALIASDKPRMEAARKRLIDDGKAADLVNSFPTMQVAILDDFHRYMQHRDEIFKSMNLPYYEAEPVLKKTDELLKIAKTQGDILGPIMLPAVWKVKQAQTRLDQRLAYLRVIEAIRLYAYENKGALPEKLADIKLPIPNDPVTGKPFEYSVKDGVATLHGANPSEKNPTTNRYYELQIKK